MENENYDKMDTQERDEKIIRKFKNLWIKVGVLILAIIIIIVYHSIKG